MINRLAYLFLLLATLALIRCTKDDPVGPSRDDFRYPLEPGSVWIYDRSINLDFHPRSGTRAADSIHATIRIEVIGEEMLFDTLATIKVREQVEQDATSLTNYNFYQNRDEALYLIAVVGGAVALPKKTTGVNHAFAPVFSARFDIISGLDGNLIPIAVDSLHLEKPAKVVLRYPLTAGVEWTYSEKNRPRRIKKRVLGDTEVNTPIGTFKAVKVQWIVDFDGDGEFDDNLDYIDFIADQGLVKRSFLIRNLPLLDDDGGNIGYYDYHDQSFLVSFTK
ncbi:hypothetical protein JXA02_04390 [candidate division KSB1 bacterium]|nr:hypothetical protein [candidate division KSB1 bacterium]RQW08932.1 MAG: hypothetical protein EH222_04955 [candidate division KSB1 bacterium]